MKVSIIQRILPEYRIQLFSEMNSMLKDESIDFALYYGKEEAGATPVTVETHRAWTVLYPNVYFKLFGRTIVVQKLKLLRVLSSDLIIIEQANNLLLNYLLFIAKPFFGYQLAYWGHGYNRQSKNSQSSSEKLKRILLKRVDWWFAYTQGTSDFLADQNFPRHRITVLKNTIDTAQFQTDLDSVSKSDILEFSKQHNIYPEKSALYCGGFTKLKDIAFLLESAVEIKKIEPDFSLLLIGNGPEESLIDNYSAQYSWIHNYGKAYGKKKAIIFKSSSCLLMPGMVGLVAIDAIVSELPIIIRDLTIHSPEIEYVTDYETGLCTSETMDDYVKAVLSLFSLDGLKNKLANNCKRCKSEFAIETMATSFSTGIKDCLSLKSIRMSTTVQ